MHKILKWVPAILVMFIIFLGSSIPGSTIRSTGHDKEVYHVIAHFVLFFCLFLAYYYATRSVLRSLLFTVTYGFLDETHQMFVPLRSPSVKDILVDSFAGAVGGVIIHLWRTTINRA